MKLSLIFLSLCFVGTLQDNTLAGYWNEGAARVGELQLEPDLPGSDLLVSLPQVISTYIENLYGALFRQFSDYMDYYIGGASMRCHQLLEFVSNIDSTTPSDAFDVIILEDIDFLNEVLSEIKDYPPKTKELKSLPKVDLRTSQIQPRTKKHALIDFLSYFDLVLTSDLAMLSSYINEMLDLGKEAVLQHYQEFETVFQSGIHGICEEMELYINISEANKEKINQHTSSWIIMNYEKVKAEIANILTSEAICSLK